ncbi:response regulator [Nodosilinea sp. LEGE 07088]|uniref:response regulator n=1 Tax=Nodosilinea sp. LEGE 07088 TaxID=2777968 RepID=UPI0018822E14|nr:response regulator [Nodosilinea sp. LEGE 07088]MBE9138760.1 response regulator [Nodosilinea sp. LEGE 07088]
MVKAKCILIIDDEPDIREIAKVSLQFTKQWKVLTASSGLEGIDIAVAQQPNLILLDLAMPEIDGLTTLKQLRSNLATQNIPVLLLTATAKIAQRTEYGELGAQGILLKPFDPGTLGDQIEAILCS